jgi:hypothetical protein
MKYAYVITKMKKVVESCTTRKQLEVAERYCHLLILMYARNTEIVGDTWSFEMHFTKMELFDYFYDIMTLKREEIEPHKNVIILGE